MNPPAPRRNPQAQTGTQGQSSTQGQTGTQGRGSSQANNAKHARRTDARPPEAKPADFWRMPPKSAAPPPITPAADPAALLRSLGRPPLDQNGADRYLAAVAERAAGLATALAVAADILAPGQEE